MNIITANGSKTFSSIAVPTQSDITAGTTSDTLNIVAPSGMVVNTTPGTNTLTLIATVMPGNQILSGSAVWSSDLTFYVSGAGPALSVEYILNGIYMTAAPADVTLDTADLTDPRIDVIAVDDTNTIVVITGTPSPTPTKPEVDADTQVELTFVLVGAGATTPDITTYDIYQDNIGTPDEWTATGTAGSVNVDSSSQTFQSSAKSIEFTEPGSVGVNFVPLTPQNMSNVDVLDLWIKFKTVIPSTRTFRFRFLNGATASAWYTITNLVGGLDYSNTTDWQGLTIPTYAFNSVANPLPNIVDQMQFRIAGSGSFGVSGGFYIDQIRLLENVDAGSGLQNVWVNVTGDTGETIANSPTDTLFILSGDGGGATRISGDTVYIDGLIPAGGSTNQVLQKTSNTDYDYAWASFSGISGTIDTDMIAFGASTGVINGSMDLTVTTASDNIKLNLGTAGCYIQAVEAASPGVFENLSLQAVEYIDLNAVAGGINITAGNGLVQINGTLQLPSYTTNGIMLSTFGDGTVGTLSLGGIGNVLILDGSGEPSFQSTLSDSSNMASLDYQNRVQYDTSGTSSLDYANRYLYDTSAFVSIDWGNRLAYDASGLVSIDWSSSGVVEMPCTLNLNDGGSASINLAGANDGTTNGLNINDGSNYAYLIPFVRIDASPAQENDVLTKGSGNYWYAAPAGVQSFSTQTTTYTITSSDYILIGEHATVAFTMTLPAVSSITIGKEYIIKNKGAAEVTIAGDGSELIDGTNTKILNQYDSMTIINDGTQWLII